LAVIYCELGRKDEAQAEFESLARDHFGGIPRDALWLTCIVYLAEVCAFLSNATHAAVLYQLLLPYAGRTVVVGGGVVCYGAASRYLGLLAVTMSRWQEAAQHFEGALALNARMGARSWLAHTQHDYAVMLLGRGRSDDQERAVFLLDKALTGARALGMHGLEERVSAQMKRVEAQPQVMQVYPDGFSLREVEVLRLLAIGRSNRDIADTLCISLSTVATHVRNILSKTGAVNRTEAAAYAMRQGLLKA
jgi:DNA-binding NarL/FixJ family response regulator